ncbi:MAG TPA: response regulator [Polyangiaceae bacterium]|nr:response regulator [Polyangiaceae bacterium]
MISEKERTRGSVLIVDDDELIRETLCELVEMTGCSALEAANGKAALKVMAEHRPCLIILDLLMPVMTGNELLAVMRQDPALADIPVVISTSAPNHAPPGFPILRKPVNIDDVVAWIRRTCRCTEG